MKKIVILNVLSVFMFLACKSSTRDVTPIVATNNVSYNDKTYPINYGYFIDYGIDFNAYNLFFTLTDQVYGDTANIAKSKVFINIDAYSPNDIFKDGIYKIDPNLYSENAIDELYVDIDNEEITIVSGIVNIISSRPNFTIEIDALTNNNKKLKGSFAAKFVQHPKPN